MFRPPIIAEKSWFEIELLAPAIIADLVDAGDELIKLPVDANKFWSDSFHLNWLLDVIPAPVPNAISLKSIEPNPPLPPDWLLEPKIKGLDDI